MTFLQRPGGIVPKTGLPQLPRHDARWKARRYRADPRWRTPEELGATSFERSGDTVPKPGWRSSQGA